MSQSAGGMVKVDRFELLCMKLSQSKELALLNDLARRAKAQFGPGGFFQKSKPALDWLKEQKRTTEYQMAVARIAEMEASGSLPSGEAVESFRQTPEGVAVELFWRTREPHAEVTLDELRAVITETNCLEVHLGIIEAVTDDNKSD